MEDTRSQTHVCLNMIVRNESKNILRCLNSCLQFLRSEDKCTGAIVISDTGSTDDTIEKIHQFGKEHDIPVTVHSDEWVHDYAKNRNIALRYAMSLYHGENWYYMFMDADTELFTSMTTNDLIHDEYKVEMRRGDYNQIIYDGVLLVRSTCIKRWRCPVHEYIEQEPKTRGTITGYVDNTSRGFRSQDPNTLKKDAMILKRGLTDPDNVDILDRVVYYLGNTYYDLRNTEKATKYYKRLLHDHPTSWVEQKYVANLRIFICNQDDEHLGYLFDAIQCNPERMDAYYYLVQYFCKNKLYRSAYVFAKDAMDRSVRTDSRWLSVATGISTYGFDFWAAMACYYCGDKKNAKRLNQQALETMPKDHELYGLAVKNEQWYHS